MTVTSGSAYFRIPSTCPTAPISVLRVQHGVFGSAFPKSAEKGPSSLVSPTGPSNASHSLAVLKIAASFTVKRNILPVFCSIAMISWRLVSRPTIVQHDVS